MVREVIWPQKVQNQLAEAYNYILSNSYQSAEKVKKEILASTDKLVIHPEMFPADKYRKNNDGSFRAYELYHYRISYQITQDKIIIVRIKHTSRQSKFY